MAKITTKAISIDELYPVKRELNVRDPLDGYSNKEGLKADILANGLMTPLLIHFQNGNFHRILQGNLRAEAIGELHKEFPTDRQWETVECRIVHDLDQKQQGRFLNDDGNVTPLNLPETVRSIWMSLDSDPTFTDAGLADVHQGQLGRHFKVPSPDKKSKDEIAKFYRGTIQCIRYMYDLPDIARPLMWDIVKDKQSVSYARKDIAELRKVFKDECLGNPLLGKDNPGEAFLIKWNQFVENEEAKAGENHGKTSISAMTKKEQEQFAANSSSFIFKMQIAYSCRTAADANKKMDLHSKVLARDVEPFLTPAAKAALIAVNEGRYADAGFTF